MKRSKACMFGLVLGISLVLSLFGGISIVHGAIVSVIPNPVEQWKTSEITLSSQYSAGHYSDPVGDVDVTATFTYTGTGGGTIVRHAFWDGGNTWKIRFAPTKIGTWNYNIVNNQSDTGLVGSGSITSNAYSGNLDMYKHGFVKVSDNKRYFTYDDGTPFFWLSEVRQYLQHEKVDSSNYPGGWSYPTEAPNTSMSNGITQKRIGQGFTAAQIAILDYGAYVPSKGIQDDQISDIYQDVDKKIKYMADSGLLTEIYFGSQNSINMATNTQFATFKEFLTDGQAITGVYPSGSNGIDWGSDAVNGWKSIGPSGGMPSRSTYLNVTGTSKTKTIALPSGYKLRGIDVGNSAATGTATVTIQSQGNTDVNISVDAGKKKYVETNFSTQAAIVTIIVSNPAGMYTTRFDNFSYDNSSIAIDRTIATPLVIKLSKYMQARYGSYPTFWLVGADPIHPEYLSNFDYTGYNADVEYWRQAELAIYNLEQVSYKHPQSMYYNSVGYKYNSFWDKPQERYPVYFQTNTDPWYAYSGPQASHYFDDGRGYAGFSEIAVGQPDKYWYYYNQLGYTYPDPNVPVKPLIEESAMFDNIQYIGQSMSTTDLTRRAAYTAIQSGAIGYNYGAHGVDSATWDDNDHLWDSFSNHMNWYVGVDLPGGTQMGYLKKFYTDNSLPWWALVPMNNHFNTIVNWNTWVGSSNWDSIDMPQVKADSALNNVTVYYPASAGKITGLISLQAPGSNYIAKWYNPRTGQWGSLDVPSVPDTAFTTINDGIGGGVWNLPPKPDENDWCLLIQRTTSPTPTPDPVIKGNWRLDEGLGTTAGDSSQNNNNGALLNGAKWTTNGIKGNAVKFDGFDDYVSIPDSSTLDGMGTLTLSAWVNLSQLPVQNYEIVGKDSGGSYSYRIVVASNGTGHFAVKTANNGWYTPGTFANFTTALSPNVWYNIVGTYDGSNVRVYVNGVLQGTGSQVISGNIYNSTSPVTLGYKSDSSIDYTKGMIDEVRIYNTALSSTEVQNLYNSYSPPDPTPTPDPSTKGDWRMDEASGTAVNDSTGNNNNGSLRNGAHRTIKSVKGNAVGLDGIDDYVSIPDSITLDGMSGLTVSTWVNLAQLPVQDYIPVGKDSNGVSYRFVILSNGYGHFAVATTNNAWYSSGTTANLTTALSPNTWYHIVGTYDGSYVRIYLNGVLQGTGSQAISGSIIDSAAPVTFGYKTNTTDDYMKGVIDETRIFNRALSSSEVQSLYKSYPVPSPAPTPVPTPDPNIKSDLRFNEGSGTTAADSSGNNNNGTLVNGAGWAVNGKFGSAVNLDGIDDYVSIPDSSTLDGMSALTVSAWVNLSQLPAQNYVIVGKDSGGSYSYRIVVASNGTGHFAVKTANNGWYTAGTVASFASVLTTNTWHHIVGTYDGGYVRIYVDGMMKGKGSQAISGSIFNSTSPVTIGYKSDTNIDYTKGMIDEVKVYDKALSDKEVQDVFEYTYDPCLKGDWRINEGSGSTAGDTSWNNNSGTLMNGAAWTIEGKSGTAVNLDGVDDYVNIPDSSTLDGMSALTVSAWVNLSQLPAQNYDIVTKAAGAQDSYRILVAANGTGHFVVKTTNNEWYSAGTTASFTTALSPNTWYHIVGTYDGSSVKVYVNGVLQGTGSQAISGSIYNSTTPVTFGYKTDPSVDYTKGIIDEVQVYNKALSAVDVQDLYNSY